LEQSVCEREARDDHSGCANGYAEVLRQLGEHRIGYAHAHAGDESTHGQKYQRASEML
jgi:hypothetical protein